MEPTTKRNSWRASINSGVELFEKNRIEAAKAKRTARKKRQQERERRSGQQNQQIVSTTTTHPNQTHPDQEQIEPPPGHAVVADDGRFRCDVCAALGHHEVFETLKGLKAHARRSKRHNN